MNDDIQVIENLLKKHFKSKVISCDRCRRGVAARNYKVCFESGVAILVRLDDRRRLSDIACDDLLMGGGAGQGVVTPSCHESWGLPRGLIVSVRPWIDGDVIVDALVCDDVLQNLGKILAQIHNAYLADLGLIDRQFFYLPIYHRSNITNQLLEEAPQILKERPEIARLVSFALKKAEEWVGMQMPFSPIGLIHGDFSPSNLIQAGSKFCVIDWEKSCLGPLYSDIAQAIYYFSPILNAREKSSIYKFIDAYQSVRKIENHEALQEWLRLHPLHIFLHDTARTIAKLKINDGDHFLYFSNESVPRFKNYLELNGWQEN